MRTGRINRLQYLAGLVLAQMLSPVVLFALAYLIAELFPSRRPGEGMGQLLVALLATAVIVFLAQAFLAAPRVRDLGISALWVVVSAACVAVMAIAVVRSFDAILLLLVELAVANLCLLLLACLPGQAGANRFGSQPRAGWLP